jgi:predicted adenine nucleotide alpha hydrolase (AANH) superfamily ATPase
MKEIKGLETAPERWERCTKCYDLRLKKTAELAQELWIINWTTSLNISPHKNLDKLFNIWDKYSFQKDLVFLKIPFKKNNWFERSVEYTKKYNIYRQNYCWCIYSATYPSNNN